MSAVFRAMNTDVQVVTPGLGETEERRLAARIADLFEASERCFSRFREDSELERLNRDGRLTPASPDFLDALRRARRYVRLTEGRFNPAVGTALIAAGYNRSFAAGRLDRHAQPPASSPVLAFSAVTWDEATRLVTLPRGVRLDFGGFIKGWTVDRAAALLPSLGVIEAGGDAVLRGAGPDGRGWLVDVEDPADADRIVATLRVQQRAVATSAPNRRRWRVGDTELHHLIDPTTGQPARSDLAQVTVLAGSAELADVLAKTAFLLGAREACRFLIRVPRVSALLVLKDRTCQTVGSLELDDAA
ncbi:MAG: FAD:protein FMN transferase [Chloroflexi bacterium]|nr:FAD:protein FMN transferase [Chloroflexota bacterium]